MKLAHIPPIVVESSTSVLEAIRTMVDNSVGAVVVVSEGQLRGIFSERDVMKKVIYHNLPPESTPVAEVMTKEVESIHQTTEPAEALRLMIDRHVRHLPIVGEDGNVIGILSIRDLLQGAMPHNPEDANRVVSGARTIAQKC
jgi:CBS domain-containing protein